MPTWKQPIDWKRIKEIFNPTQDYVASDLFLRLLLSARNDHYVGKYRNKFYTLKRGQSIFGRRKYAKYLRVSDKTAQRILDRLTTTYHLVTQQKSNNFTVVTILFYDEWVKLDPAATQQRPSSDPAATTNKSVENVESVERIRARARAGNSTPLKKQMPSESALRKSLTQPVVLASLKRSYPTLDLGNEIERYINFVLSRGINLVNYVPDLRNWLQKGLQFQKGRQQIVRREREWEKFKRDDKKQVEQIVPRPGESMLAAIKRTVQERKAKQGVD